MKRSSYLYLGCCLLSCISYSLNYSVHKHAIIDQINPSPQQFKKLQKWFRYKIPLNTPHVQKKIKQNKSLKKKDCYTISLEHILGIQQRSNGTIHGWHWDPSAFFLTDFFEVKPHSFFKGPDDCYMVTSRIRGCGAKFKTSSFFPAQKSGKQVLKMIIQAYNNPTYSIQQKDQLTIVGRSKSNVPIKMCIDTKTQEIKTAFPLIE